MILGGECYTVSTFSDAVSASVATFNFVAAGAEITTIKAVASVIKTNVAAEGK